MFVSVGPRVELPEFGVGVGKLDLTAGELCVHVNNRIDGGEVRHLLVIPVKRIEPDGSKYRMFRPTKAEDASPVTESDLDVTVAFESPEPTERLRADSRQTSTGKEPVRSKREPELTRQAAQAGALENMRETARYVGYRVKCTRWDGTDGLLFLQYFGPSWKEHKPAIVCQLRGMLARKNVERCVIPPSATERRAGTDKLCFALGSCQFTSGLLDSSPRWDEFRELTPGPADASYDRLAKLLRSASVEERPELLVLAGDQVYVDGTAGLFDPAIEDGRYRKPYEQLLSSMRVQEVTRQIPICAMLDDHEIEDNWEREDAEAENNLRLGRQGYLDYQRQGSLLDEPTDPAKLWSPLKFRGFDFFFADTRTDREKRTSSDLSTKRMLREDQLAALKRWLTATNTEQPERPKFIVTPSVLLPSRHASKASPKAPLLSDAWDGYPNTRDELLNFIADQRIRNVFFLSGDEHLCMTATAELVRAPEIVVYSVHSSGFYTPFPFANAIREDFIDAMTLPTSPANAWNVSTRFADGEQGFAVIQVEMVGRAWTVKVTFDLSNGKTIHSIPEARTDVDV